MKKFTAPAVCGECLTSLAGYLPGVTLCDDCHDGVQCSLCDDAHALAKLSGLAYTCPVHD